MADRWEILPEQAGRMHEVAKSTAAFFVCSNVLHPNVTSLYDQQAERMMSGELTGAIVRSAPPNLY